MEYWYSKEGEAAYKAVGLQYPKTVFDHTYDDFHKMTKESPAELNQTIILNMRRVRSPFVDENHNKDITDKAVLEGEKQREYLVYDMMERRIDGLGNERHRYRSNLGTYPIPIPKYVMKRDPDTHYEQKIVAGTMGTRKGYSILFTKENVEKLLKQGYITPEDPKELAKQDTKRQQAASKTKAAISVRSTNEVTHFSVQVEGERQKRGVKSYTDFIEGTFDELYNFSHANVSEDEWLRRKAVNDIAAAQLMGADQAVLDKISQQIERIRSGEGKELYK